MKMEIYERIFGCVAAFYTHKCFSFLRFVLLVINLALGVFDCYTDFEVWRTLTNEGFQHPLLQLPPGWATAWLVFTILGTITFFLNALNEISLLLHICEVDVCQSCAGRGCNFVTRSEALTLINIFVEDLPLLILTILYAATRYSCNHPTPSDSHELSILRTVLLSSLASTAAVGWTFVRGTFRVVIRCCRDGNRVMRMNSRDIEKDEKDEKVKSNELYPEEHNMGHCMRIHTILMLLFHIVTFALSFGATILTIVLLTHGIVGVNADPNKELNVYLEYPKNEFHHLTNTSAILERGNEGLCHTVTFNETIECTLFIKYDSDNYQLEFNFVSTSKNIQESESSCADFFEHNDIFLGHDTPTDGVKRFDEICLVAWVTSGSTGSVQRDRDLYILC